MPLTYRAAADRPRPRPSRPAAPVAQAPRPITGHVPPDLASALQGSHRVDVSSIPVHRGPEVSAEARSLGARAFTRGGDVFLPAEAGPLDTPKARGLLAHELVHAVQQRTLGSTLPAAHTPAGVALEAEAVAAERTHAGQAEPAPLVHPSLTQVMGQAARTVGVQLAPLHEAAAPSIPPAPPRPLPVPEELGLPAGSTAVRTLAEWTAPVQEEEQQQEPEEPDPFAGGFPSIVDAGAEEPPLGRSEQDQALAAQILQVINVERAQAGEPEVTTLDAPAMDLIRRTVAERSEEAGVRQLIFAQAAATGVVSAGQAAGEPRTPSGQPVEAAAPPPAPLPFPVPRPVTEPETTPADPSDQPIEIERLDLEQLTARLYDRLRTRIRMELLIDRERAGLLTDFR